MAPWQLEKHGFHTLYRVLNNTEAKLEEIKFVLEMLRCVALYAVVAFPGNFVAGKGMISNVHQISGPINKRYNVPDGYKMPT